MRKISPHEILALKSRQEQSLFSSEVIYEIDNLIINWQKSGTGGDILTSYIPIRLVTILEVFSRNAIRSLVDFSDEYKVKAEKLIKDVKIDISFANSLQGQKVTIGDIVAQAIPLNRIDVFLSAMGTLVENFPRQLKESKEHWIEDENSNVILEDYDFVIRTLKQLVEKRNILTHEIPAEKIVTDQDVEEMASCLKQFINAVEWVVILNTTGPIPRTQSGMNIVARDELDTAKAAVEQLVGNVRKKLNIDFKKFKEAHDLWEKSALIEAELVASQVEGGSMYPCVYSSSLQASYISRAKSIETFLDSFFD